MHTPVRVPSPAAALDPPMMDDPTPPPHVPRRRQSLIQQIKNIDMDSDDNDSTHEASAAAAPPHQTLAVRVGLVNNNNNEPSRGSSANHINRPVSSDVSSKPHLTPPQETSLVSNVAGSHLTTPQAAAHMKSTSSVNGSASVTAGLVSIKTDTTSVNTGASQSGLPDSTSQPASPMWQRTAQSSQSGIGGRKSLAHGHGSKTKNPMTSPGGPMAGLSIKMAGNSLNSMGGTGSQGSHGSHGTPGRESGLSSSMNSKMQLRAQQAAACGRLEDGSPRYLPELPSTPPAPAEPALLERIHGRWEAFIDFVLFRIILNRCILPDDLVTIRLRKAIIAMSVVGSLLTLITSIVTFVDGNSSYVAATTAAATGSPSTTMSPDALVALANARTGIIAFLVFSITSLSCVELPAFFWVRQKKSCPTWLFTAHQCWSLATTIFTIFLDPSMGSILRVYVLMLNCICGRIAGLEAMMVVCGTLTWFASNNCLYESQSCSASSSSSLFSSPSSHAWTNGVLATQRIAFPFAFDPTQPITRQRICGIYPFYAFIQMLAVVFYNGSQFHHARVVAERSADMSRAAADLLKEYNTEGVTKVLNWFGTGIRIPKKVVMIVNSDGTLTPQANNLNDAAAATGGTTEANNGGAVEGGVSNASGLLSINNNYIKGNKVITRTMYDMATVENDPIHIVPVNALLVQTFRGIVSNLERYKPHLPNYVLQPESSSSDDEEDEEDEEEERGPRGHRGSRARSGYTHSEGSRGSQSSLVKGGSGSATSNHFGARVGSIDGSTLEGRLMVPVHSFSDEFFVGRITMLMMRFRWLAMTKLEAKLCHFLVGALNECGMETSASLHSIVGDLVVASWNATHRASRCEIRSCKFALALQAIIYANDELCESVQIEGGSIVTGKAACITAGDSRLKMFSLSLFDVMGCRWHQELLNYAVENGPGVTVMDDRTAETAKFDYLIRGVAGVDMSTLMGVESSATTLNILADVDQYSSTMTSQQRPRPVYELLEERPAEEKDQEWMYVLEKRKDDPNEYVTAAMFCYIDGKYTDALALLDRIYDETVLSAKPVRQLRQSIDAAIAVGKGGKS